MSSPLQGRVFHRFRAYEKLSEAITNHVPTLWQDMEQNKVLLKHTNGIPASELMSSLNESQQIKDGAISSEQAIDALVLRGFLALSNESTIDSMQVDKFATFENAKFITTKSTSSTPSVWDVREGANQAGYIDEWKTSRSWIGKKREKNEKVYAVVNELKNHVYLFSDDASLASNASVPLINATVEYDGNENRHAVTITTTDDEKSNHEQIVVTLGLPSKEDQEEWCNSIINAGAHYREMYNIATESVESIYELKDRDMQGNVVCMEKYKGKVLLIVNVSSLCGLTPTNYPELTTLYNKYRDEGLEILAFPCNQFKSQEPGTHEEIMEFVKQYGCEFPFFEKADVNGKFARPVFTYLKGKLPGTFGNFVKWNFTKFLVDHTGNPYKRFAPTDKPLSFENEIQFLLQKRNSETIQEHKL